MNLLLNISFYVPRKKECHTGLEWHEQMSTFSSELSLSWTLRNSCCLSGKRGAGRSVSSVSMSYMGLTADPEVRCVWTNVKMVYVCVYILICSVQTHLYQPCKILFDLYVFDIDKSSRMAACSPFLWASIEFPVLTSVFEGTQIHRQAGLVVRQCFFPYDSPAALSPIPSS